MKRRLSHFLVLLLIVILCVCCVSCSSSKENFESQPKEESSISEIGESAGSFPSDRKIIYTVTTTVKTDDTAKTLADIRKLVKEDEWEESVDQGSEHAVVVFRIKSTRLDEFVKGLSSTGEVVDYTKSAQDVTDKYTDIEDQLAVLEAQKDSLTALYASASTLEENMAISMKINEIEGEILVLNRQKTALDSRIDYSIVKVYINQNYRYVPPSYKQEVKDDLSASWQALGEFFKFLLRAIIYIFPFALVGGAVSVGVIFIVKYTKKKKAAKKVENVEEKKE